MKKRLIGLEIGLEMSSLLGTPLSQRGAVMRATMSFLFAQSKKLGVTVIPGYILSSDLHSNCLAYNLIGGR